VFATAFQSTLSSLTVLYRIVSEHLLDFFITKTVTFKHLL